MRIVWSSKLETGIRTIDLQHEELIGMINELDEAHRAGSNRSLLNDILQRLGSYVSFHFRTEEALMVGLPKTEKHASEHLHQHRLFVEQLAAMRLRAEGEFDGAINELADFLNSWLYDHILKTDRQLGVLLSGSLAQPRPLHPPV